MGIPDVRFVEGEYGSSPTCCARGDRPDRRRLRPRPLDRGGRVVRELPRLRPLPDRRCAARRSPRPEQLAGQDGGDLRRPGGRALGQAEHPRGDRSGPTPATRAGSRRSSGARPTRWSTTTPSPPRRSGSTRAPRSSQFNLNQSRYAVGVPAGNDDLLDAVNRALARIKASSAYGDLVRRYLSYKSEDVDQADRRAEDPHGPRRRDAQHDRRGPPRLADRWEEIWQLNRERIANPHLIYPGYVLLMPEG